MLCEVVGHASEELFLATHAEPGLHDAGFEHGSEVIAVLQSAETVVDLVARGLDLQHRALGGFDDAVLLAAEEQRPQRALGGRTDDHEVVVAGDLADGQGDVVGARDEAARRASAEQLELAVVVAEALDALVRVAGPGGVEQGDLAPCLAGELVGHAHDDRVVGARLGQHEDAGEGLGPHLFCRRVELVPGGVQAGLGEALVGVDGDVAGHVVEPPGHRVAHEPAELAAGRFHDDPLGFSGAGVLE